MKRLCASAIILFFSIGTFGFAQEPETAATVLDRGIERKRALDFDRALADFDRIIERFLLGHLNWVAYSHRGYTWKLKGDLDRAIADYDWAIKLNPREPVLFLNRAAALVEKDRADLALRDFAKAIELDPANVRAWFERGMLRLNTHEYDAAIADFDAVIRLDPRLADAHVNRGFALMNRNELGAAKAAIERAIELEPRNMPAWFSLGVILEAKADATGATAAYDQVVELDPKYAEAYSSRGLLKWLKKDDLSGALADFNRAVELGESAPALAQGYFNRALLLETQGKLDLALADFDKAIALAPKHARAYQQRGFLYLTLGKAGKSQRDLAVAQRLDPSLEAVPTYESMDLAERLPREEKIKRAVKRR